MGFLIKLIAWIGVFGSAIGCFALWPDRYAAPGGQIPALLFLGGGLVSSFLTYAIGHIVDRVDELHVKLVAGTTSEVSAPSASSPDAEPSK